MMRFLKLLPIAAAAFVFYFAAPLQTYTESSAQVNIVLPNVYIPDPLSLLPKTGTPSAGGPKAVKADGSKFKCKDLPEAKGVLLGMLVPCITYTIEQSTEAMSERMVEWLMPLVYSFLTLVIALFGVKILQGEQQVHVQGFLLMVKVAFVIMILQIIPTYVVPQTYAIMNEGVQIVTSGLAGDEAGIGCDVEVYGDENTALIWKQSDCILGKLYGFTTGKNVVTGEKTTNMLLASSAFGLLSGFFFGGTAGVVLFFALIGVLLSIAIMILRIATAYVNGYLTVCVMLLIAPIFMPLIFLKVTTDYFEKWWKAILGGIMLPIIISAYTVVALLVYDAILFKPDSKLQHLFNNKEIQSAMQVPASACSAPIAGNSTMTQQTAQTALNKNNTAPVSDVNDPITSKKVRDYMASNPFTQIFSNPLLSASNDPCGPIKKTRFEVSKIRENVITQSKDPAFADKKNVMKEMFMEAVLIFITAFVISSGLRTVQSSMASFAAGSSIGPVLMNARDSVTANIEGAIGGFSQRMQSQMVDIKKDDKGNQTRTDVKGADFVARLPTAIKNSTADTIKGFLGGVKRE